MSQRKPGRIRTLVEHELRQDPARPAKLIAEICCCSLAAVTKVQSKLKIASLKARKAVARRAAELEADQRYAAALAAGRRPAHRPRSLKSLQDSS